MIYSASRRTDMPAFYPDAIVEKVSRSRKLEAIVFWTKDARNLVRHPGLAAITARSPSIVQLTVTGLAGSRWEPGVPPLSAQLPELRELSRSLPRGAVRWRFDPIIPSPDLFDRFRAVKETLESALGTLDGVTVSFPDPYRHAVARSVGAGLKWPAVRMDEKKRILAALIREFPETAAPLRLCCEPDLLTIPGVAMAKCVDGSLFEQLYAIPLGRLDKDQGQRVACGCSKSTDIGSYAMRCSHHCLYCYATPNE